LNLRSYAQILCLFIYLNYHPIWLFITNGRFVIKYSVWYILLFRFDFIGSILLGRFGSAKGGKGGFSHVEVEI